MLDFKTVQVDYTLAFVQNNTAEPGIYTEMSNFLKNPV